MTDAGERNAVSSAARRSRTVRRGPAHPGAARSTRKTDLPSLDMPAPAMIRIRSLALRASVLAVAWWVLAQGHPDSLWVGVPVIVGAAAASMYLAPPGPASRLRAGALARLAIYFLWHSLRGGVDVALRALNPRLPLAPALLEYPLRLPPGPARVLLANTVSLMPGTLSATLWEDVLCVHVLDRRQPVATELRTLEARVAEAFGLSADPPPTARNTGDGVTG